MLLLSIAFYFHYNICGWVWSTGPFQYRWLKWYIYSSSYYHRQIGSMMSANSRIHFGLQIVLVCLYITPSHFLSLCKLIWRHWTYRMPVRYILSSVWVRLSIFSQLSILRYVGLCVFSLPISLVMIARIYTVCHQLLSSSNRKCEVLPSI